MHKKVKIQLLTSVCLTSQLLLKWEVKSFIHAYPNQNNSEFPAAQSRVWSHGSELLPFKTRHLPVQDKGNKVIPDNRMLPSRLKGASSSSDDDL